MNPELENQRNRAMEFLADCYARNIITVDDYERRIDLVSGAQDFRAIDHVLFDLHPRDAPSRPVRHGEPPRSEGDAGTTIVAILGSRTVSGPWLPGTFASSVAIMGSQVLDLRDMEAKDRVQINVVAVMGEVKIRVPAHARVQVTATPIMAEISDKSGPPRQGGTGNAAGTGPSEVLITGLALMAEIKIRRG